MYHQTRGIVLKTIDYSDSGIIVKMYTERFGLQSYLVNGRRSKRSNIRINLFQPLSLLDMVVSRNEKYQLQKIRELRIDIPFVNIAGNIAKSSIALFINEIIYRSIKEEEANSELFNFIRSSLLYLDLNTGNCSNFHLLFLVQLSRYIGFYPSGNILSGDAYFDLKEGIFESTEPVHGYFLTKEQTGYFAELMKCNYEHLEELTIGNQARRELLDKLVLFYELHLNNSYEITSHRILEEVIS
jgi:DNA repair protein RecO (recombination protein O)